MTAILAWLVSNFFEGGLFGLLQSFVGWILGFFTALGNLFINGILAIATPVNNVIPDPQPLLSTMQTFFDYASTYIGYAVDMSFVSSAVLVYLISSYIFRVVARRNVYLIKAVVNWIGKLKK